MLLHQRLSNPYNNLAHLIAILTNFGGFAFFFKIKGYFTEKTTQ